MAVLGTLSSVNLIAGAGILGNVGGVPIAANSSVSNNIGAYTSVPVVSRFASLVATGFVPLNIVSGTFPALTNSIPTAFQSNLGNATLTSSTTIEVNNLLGDGDIGKFAQVLSAAQGYVSQTNRLIKTTLNATDANNVTGFTTQDNLSTGGLSGVSEAFAALGADLAQLGFLIDLNNLNNLGSPAALLRQIATIASTTPALNTALLNAGLPADLVDAPDTAEYTDQQQRLIYQAMTQVTGESLAQILRLLRVTTPGITTMADLLNPVKILPRSYNTLTAPTANGLRGIYINEVGAVNTRLETELPTSVLAPLTGNPLQNLPPRQQ
jgi:hypothetical protein